LSRGPEWRGHDVPLGPGGSTIHTVAYIYAHVWMEMVLVSQSTAGHQAGATTMALPPGQPAIVGFPSVGAHGPTPPPAVPAGHRIQVTGLCLAPLALRLSDLDQLARQELTADHHCVAGWSALGLRWSCFWWGGFL